MIRDKLDYFKNGLSKLEITLTEKQFDQFICYYNLLMEWNKVMNLTTIIEFDEVVTKHFIDSLSLIHAIELKENLTVIDIGTGAGFPGIPLKIAFPHLEITLLDSLQKRVKFLDEVIATLKLESIKAIHGRAEDFAKPNELREKYDLAVSRAVANLSTLTEYCLPFVKMDGRFISYKSEKIVEEIEKAKKGIQRLGGKIENQVAFHLPDSDINRNLIVIRKVKLTPKQYPRKSGLPAKEPLIK